MAFEEATLVSTFGPTYTDYQGKVSRWWPSLSPQYPASPHPFDLAGAIRSERSTLVNIALVGILFYLKNRV